MNSNKKESIVTLNKTEEFDIELRSIRLRKFNNILFKSMVFVVALAAVVPLLLILSYIFQKGISAINFNFFISGTKPTGEPGGGIFNALVGTILLIATASLISIPSGILAGIYLAENRTSKIADMVRWSIDLIQGVPSIVLGVIGYAWFVLPMARLTGGKVAFSALSGGLTLAIIMIPVIIKSTEETIKLLPETLKEASIALGVTYHQTILKVVLPASLSGIMTGILVGIARVSGETAPLLFTAFGNYYFNANLLKPVDSLPLMIFNYATSPYEDLRAIAWGASFVLVAFVLLLNISARIMVKKWKT